MARKVVIVDDNTAMRKALCRLFRAAAGFQDCAEASSGLEAIELVRKSKPDLIVLDLCMPDMNGLEVAQRLKSMKVPVPMILYSMNAEEIAAKEAYAAGVAALVSKAEGIKTLIAKARTLLDHSAA